jgi:antitoxin component of MazEF toxin-antitoxin module
MPEQRHVYRLGNSMVVALPPAVRKHLGVERGGAVYWHLVRGHEAVLTKKERRKGGHPEGLALQRQLAHALAEVERLQKKLGARPMRLLHQGQSMGWSQAMQAEGSFGRVLEEIAARLGDLEARWPYRAPRVRRRVERVAAPVLGPDDEPPPNLPPMPPSGGAVASGAASPQATHS